jgi:hypothetical protein
MLSSPVYIESHPRPRVSHPSLAPFLRNFPNLQTFQPSNLPTIFDLSPFCRATKFHAPLCFHSLTNCPFSIPFVLTFIHVMGGIPPFSVSPTFRRGDDPLSDFGLLPLLRVPNSFICNTYGPPRKCCKQKTYVNAKSFRRNTYKKPGVWCDLNVPTFKRSNVQRSEHTCPKGPLRVAWRTLS